MAPRVPRFTPGPQGATAFEATPVRAAEAATEETFGAAQATAIRAAGEVLTTLTGEGAKIALRERDLTDANEVSKMQTKTVGDTESFRNNYMGKNKGAQATKGLPKALQDYDQIISDNEALLSSDRQKRLYRAQVASNVARFKAGLGRYAFIEDQNDRAATDILRKESIVEGALSEIATPNSLEGAKDEMEGQIRLEAERLNKNQEWVKLETKKWITRIHDGVIGNLLGINKGLAAKEYFDEVKDEILGSEFARINKKVQQGTELAESQQQSDRIFNTTDNVTEAKDKARKIKDPEVRQKTLSLLDSRFRDVAEADKAQRSAAMTSASTKVEGGGALTPDDRQFLTDKQNASLDKRSRQVEQGIEPVTDWNRYTELRLLGSSPQGMSKFIKLNLQNDYHRLAFRERGILLGIQDQARRRDPDFGVALSDFRGKQRIVNDIASSLGIAKGNLDDYNNAIADEQIRLQKETGAPVTDEKLAEIAWQFGKNAPGTGLIFDKAIFQLTIDDVPDDDLPKLRQRAKAHKINRGDTNTEPTDKEIVQLYRLVVQKELNAKKRETLGR